MRAICPKQSRLTRVQLRCRKCGKLYRTKNINYVGARTVFPVEGDCEHGLDDLEAVCPKEIDVKSFQEELALYRSQGRTNETVDKLFRDAYGKTPEDLGLTYIRVRKEEIDKVIDELWKHSRGEELYFTEIGEVSERVLHRLLNWKEIEVLVKAYYKRSDSEEVRGK